nr:G-type lectin S-receptor-like serine/threonine-protein kinase At4g27290 [Ipomoea trifida]
MVFIFFISIIISILHFSAAVDDTLATNQTLSDDGGTMLVSASQTFVLGFFSPGSSRNRYLGIWVRNEPERTVVWVANNNNPISDFSGVLRLTPTGELIIISSNTKNQVANIVWSFDYPGDTLLAGMKIGWNLKTKSEWYLKSWRTQNDPSTGDFTFRIDILGLPTGILRRGSTVQFRTGTWDGRKLGQYSFVDLYMGVLKPIFVYNDETAYYMFQSVESSSISRLVVSETGQITISIWRRLKKNSGWFNIGPIQVDHCDPYGTCGNNSLCIMIPYSNCSSVYVPRNQQKGKTSKGFDCIISIDNHRAVPAGHNYLLTVCHAVIGREESLALQRDSSELPMIIAFDELVAATNNFSEDNKLGAGGFGSVYKAWQLWIERREGDLID